MRDNARQCYVQAYNAQLAVDGLAQIGCKLGPLQPGQHGQGGRLDLQVAAAGTGNARLGRLQVTIVFLKFRQLF